MEQKAKKVLVVDDDPHVLKTVQIYLKKNGLYDILLAESAEKALEILGHEKISIVISDIMMSGMTGLELLSKIRKYYPETKVILMTGYSSDKIRQDVKNSGCLYFLQKPFNAKDLSEVISENISEKDQGFFGTLKNIQLIDMIQMCCMAGVNTAIGVHNGDQNGTIFISNSTIPHAVCGDKQGEAAFYEIISWRSGSFETLGAITMQAVTIKKGWEYLVMEGVRRIDETKEKQLPDHSVPDMEGVPQIDESEEKRLSDHSAPGSESAIRVLVVDNSPLIRKALTRILSADEAIRVIGTARNGEEAIEKIAFLKPDLITLDVNMPAMDGRSALKHIMIKNPCPILIISSFNISSGKNILDFLWLGAVDFIHKPLKADHWESQQKQLIKKVKIVAGADIRHFKILKPAIIHKKLAKTEGNSCRLLTVINSGAGGYAELIRLVCGITDFESLCVVAIQSMPEIFMPVLADYLNQYSPCTVMPLTQDVPLEGGRCYIGTNDLKITLTKMNGNYRITQNDDIAGNKAFDSFLRSADDSFERSLLIVLLSGAEIGSFELLKRVKAVKIAQKMASCMVPEPLRKAAREGIIDHELNIPDIASCISGK